MSISSETRKSGPHSGNGITVAFPFSFKVFSTSDVLVVETDPAESETTLVLGSDYSVSLNSDQENNPGGTVTTTTAPATGYKITLGSAVPLKQPAVFTNNGGFFPDVINAALDRLTIIAQQLSEKVGRAVKVNISSSVSPDELIGDLQSATYDAASAAISATSAAAAAAASVSAANNSAIAAAASASAATFPWTPESGGIYYAGGNVRVPNGTLVMGSAFSFRNKIINGDMRADQRNSGGVFTLATSGNYGGPDRFVVTWDGTLGAGTVQRLGFANGAGMFPDNKYYYEWNQTSGGSGNTGKVLQQRIESVETLNGETATFSFWAKAGAAITVTPDLVQFFGTGGSPSAAVTTTGTAINLTTSWARYVVTFAVPSIVGKVKGSSGSDALWVRLGLPPNSAFTLDTTGWQLEEGSVATPFESRPIGLELALCQRYFEYMPVCGFIGNAIAVGSFIGNFIQFAVPKRVTPTLTSGTASENVNLSTTSLSAAGINEFRYYGEAIAPGNAYITRPVSASAEL